MINVSDVAAGLLGMGLLVGASVGLVAVGGRDRTADQHDLTDYHAPQLQTNDEGVCWRCGAGVSSSIPGALCERCLWAADILPPAPAVDVRAPLYAETLFRTWHPDAPDVVADRMLREIAAEQRDDVVWGAVPKRATDRDLTGCFPVARAA